MEKKVPDFVFITLSFYLSLFVIIVLSLLLFLFLLIFLSGGEKTINADIPDDKNSAKELIEIVDPYLRAYWGDRKYYVGEVKMKLNNNHEGIVEIWCKDDRGEGGGSKYPYC